MHIVYAFYCRVHTLQHVEAISRPSYCRITLYIIVMYIILYTCVYDFTIQQYAVPYGIWHTVSLVKTLAGRKNMATTAITIHTWT